MVGPVHFSSTSAKDARLGSNSATWSFDFRAAWAAAESSCSKQTHWRFSPRLAGTIFRSLTLPNLAQTDSIANLRLCSFRNGGKPFFSALFMFSYPLAHVGTQIAWAFCVYDLSGARGGIPF